MFRVLYHHSNQSSEHVGGRASSYQCVRQIKCLDVYYLTVQVYASCYRVCFRQCCCGQLLPVTVLPSVWGSLCRAALKEVQQNWGPEVKFWDKHTMKEYHIIQPSPLSSPFLPLSLPVTTVHGKGYRNPTVVSIWELSTGTDQNTHSPHFQLNDMGSTELTWTSHFITAIRTVRISITSCRRGVLACAIKTAKVKRAGTGSYGYERMVNIRRSKTGRERVQSHTQAPTY